MRVESIALSIPSECFTSVCMINCCVSFASCVGGKITVVGNRDFKS
uniref:Uncharacterized protein n=1 Tax=Rhizophora mucronata TaxID=61149 RepID=A0A2P2M0W8_RHIMU